MESMLNNKTPRKRFIMRLSCILFVFLLLCTFASMSIYQMLLPSVQTVSYSAKTINYSADAEGISGYEGLKEIRADTSWYITEVFPKKGESVRPGDELFAVDCSDAFITGEKFKLAIMSLENQLKIRGLSSSLKESIALQIEIAKAELALHEKRFPSDGIIRSEFEGIVVECSAIIGKQVQKGELLFKIAGADSKPCVICILGRNVGSGFSIGDPGYIKAGTGVNGKEYTTTIASKEWASETESWKFTLPISGEAKGLEYGAIFPVSLETYGTRYPCVIPLSCLHEDPSDSSYYIYIIEQESGLFSRENIIKKQKVELLDSNEFYAAIDDEGLSKETMIVQYSSKAIWEGCAVTLVNPL